MTTGTERFDFLRNWYPVSPLEDLDPGRPTPLELLERRYVIWKPGATDQYRIFLDHCPHRLAPLSEGRIDPCSGQLQCSYHGWQFDAAGLCLRIPQADPAVPAALQARHFCATALPTRQAQGLLWLWPDPATADHADLTPLPLSPLVDAAAGFVWSSIVRDLPYDWQTLVENVADPAHVPFAHHGVQGNREKAFPLPLDMVSEGRDELVARLSGRDFALATRIRFQPPCLLEYNFDLPGDKRFGLVTYCLPVKAGRSRIVAQFPRNFARWPIRLIPRWWSHIALRNEVLDGDLVLLCHQEKELERRRCSGEASSWQQAYRMPTSADRLVIAFRRWLDRHGPLPWQESPHEPSADPSSAEVLLDRYHQHTIHCASCRGALATIQRLQLIGMVLAVLGVAAVTLLSDAHRLQLGLPLVLLSLGTLAGVAGLRFGLEPKFRYLPYDHNRR